jgi:hypothetical protein
MKRCCGSEAPCCIIRGNGNYKELIRFSRSVQRVLDASYQEMTENLRKNDQKIGTKTDAQSIETFSAIVINCLAADENFTGEEGEQDAEVLPIDLGRCFTRLLFTVYGFGVEG